MSNNTKPSSDSAAPAVFVSPIVQNPDGTITRVFKFPSTPATPDPNSSSPVLSKDFPLNPHHNTWVRVFLLRQTLNSSSTKLPLIVFFHGGGFVTCSAATTPFHNLCADIAIKVNAVVVSVEYRLAPEHPLPAAYDDAMEALQWIKTSKDEWLREFADFSSCFLMGSSAGGNIAYHAGLRAAAADDLEPLMIKGLVLHHPFFGGSKRTRSESRSVNDPAVPLHYNDVMWELSLPIGADRDHVYSNPTVGSALQTQSLERFRLMGWRVMITGCEGDPLIDRQKEVAKMLKEKGVMVVDQFEEGGQHTVEFSDPTKYNALLSLLKYFVHSFACKL